LERLEETGVHSASKDDSVEEMGRDDWSVDEAVDVADRDDIDVIEEDDKDDSELEEFAKGDDANGIVGVVTAATGSEYEGEVAGGEVCEKRGKREEIIE
jgi:hypothetical protein